MPDIESPSTIKEYKPESSTPLSTYEWQYLDSDNTMRDEGNNSKRASFMKRKSTLALFDSLDLPPVSLDLGFDSFSYPLSISTKENTTEALALLEDDSTTVRSTPSCATEKQVSDNASLWVKPRPGRSITPPPSASVSVINTPIRSSKAQVFSTAPFKKSSPPMSCNVELIPNFLPSPKITLASFDIDAAMPTSLNSSITSDNLSNVSIPTMKSIEAPSPTLHKPESFAKVVLGPRKLNLKNGNLIHQFPSRCDSAGLVPGKVDNHVARNRIRVKKDVDARTEFLSHLPQPPSQPPPSELLKRVPSSFLRMRSTEGLLLSPQPSPIQSRRASTESIASIERSIVAESILGVGDVATTHSKSTSLMNRKRISRLLAGAMNVEGVPSTEILGSNMKIDLTSFVTPKHKSAVKLNSDIKEIGGPILVASSSKLKTIPISEIRKYLRNNDAPNSNEHCNVVNDFHHSQSSVEMYNHWKPDKTPQLPNSKPRRRIFMGEESSIKNEAGSIKSIYSTIGKAKTLLGSLLERKKSLDRLDKEVAGIQGPTIVVAKRKHVPTDQKYTQNWQHQEGVEYQYYQHQKAYRQRMISQKQYHGCLQVQSGRGAGST